MINPDHTELKHGVIAQSGPFKGMVVGYIYKWTNILNGMVYIGKTKNSPNKRRLKHEALGRKSMTDGLDKHCTCRKLYEAMAEHGVDNFMFEVLLELPLELVSINETMFIALYNSIETGYNIANGKCKDYTLSDETERRLSSALCTNKVHNRRNPKSVGCPLYLNYREHKGEGYYVIQWHPHCDYKEFKVADFESDAAAKNAAIEYYYTLPRLEAGPSKRIHKKRERYPEGIQARKGKHGVLLQLAFAINGEQRNLKKIFSDPLYSEEELIKQAEQHKPIMEAEIQEIIKNYSWISPHPAFLDIDDKYWEEMGVKLDKVRKFSLPTRSIKKSELPMGMVQKRTGYAVRRDYKGQRFEATFSSKEVPDLINYLDALEFLNRVNNKIENLKNGRPIDTDPLD